MESGVIVAGVVGGVSGMVAGGVIVAFFAGRAIAAAEREIANIKKRCETWHRKWETDNNRLAAVRDVAKTIKVAVRGPGGRVVRHETAHDRINGLLCLEGRGHECL